jgi:hypothetical protein
MSMAIDCEFFLLSDMLPARRRALGSALWAWCTDAVGGGSNYQYLDNQGLADLVAGHFPSSHTITEGVRLPYVFFTVPGDPIRDREATLFSLRRTITEVGLADVRVGGKSWLGAELNSTHVR